MKKLILITDRGYFTYTENGIQIHSGKESSIYNWKELRHGKYMPNFACYEATVTQDKNGYYVWTITLD